ncbi:peptidase M61 [Rhodoferax sp.]|uniref:M61 family metallopeptidase n=1 Tax=Rhodoferax sp. TaxID=50421 RepID=UPI0026175B2B|nr:peptidase M61 [Rhodoferax sp.]MDD5480128.1 peptidase M61 [Rhodoferax sp.]
MSSDATALVYDVRAHNLHAHLYQITLTVPQPAADQCLSLPVWIPGSYLVREFAKHLQGLQAQQNGQAVALTQLDKCSWQAHCSPAAALVLHYEVYAFDASVRTAWLDAQRGFFNGTSLCLQVHGQTQQPHLLRLSAAGLPKDWHAACALPAQKVTSRGFDSYLAANYDELVDSPVELGAFWQGHFVAFGVTHRFVVAGAPPSFDGARLLADAQRVCETEIGFWHGQHTADAPHRHYLFLLNAVHDGYGGLEHRHSTALICRRADLPRTDASPAAPPPAGYTTLLGLISHEYFHTWNVKRLRPAEFAHYNYAQENYTELLWFFEGFTSYFDDLLLRRAGLIDSAKYLTLLAKTINQVRQTPGRRVQSVAQASWDAWVKYYRPDENSANATVSYYTLGSLIALCLDLSLRQTTHSSLDAVMRTLWQRCQGGAMTEQDVTDAVTALGSAALATQLQQWVHGTADLPLEKLLKAQGICYTLESASRLEQLGLKVIEQQGLKVKSVLRGSAAEAAGMAAGDEWLGILLDSDVAPAGASAHPGWRIHTPDDVALVLGQASAFQALVARDQRLMWLPVRLPKTLHNVRLSVSDPALAEVWLATHDK